MSVLIIRYNQLGKPVKVAEHESEDQATTHALQLAEDEPGTTFHVRGEEGELLATVKKDKTNAEN